jgi:hypothetical protein
MLRLSSCLLVTVWITAIVAGQQPPTSVALVGARVIDGTGSAPISNAALLVTNGRIDRIGPAASLKIPAGSARIDVSGRYVIPGLINAHGHLNNGDRALPVYDQIIQQLRLYTRFGVTTVYALGDDGKESVRVSGENDRGPLDRARLYAAGGRATAKTAEDARGQIADRHALGVHIIKTGMNGNANDMPPEAYTALIDEAHKRKLRVASHLFNLNDAKALVGAGLDVIAHGIRDQDVDATFVAELKRRNIGYIPTLTRDLSVFQYTSTPDYVTDPFFLRGESLFRPQIERVKDPTVHAKTQSSPGAQLARRGFEQGLRNLKLLSDHSQHPHDRIGLDRRPSSRLIAFTIQRRDRRDSQISLWRRFSASSAPSALNSSTVGIARVRSADRGAHAGRRLAQSLPPNPRRAPDVAHRSLRDSSLRPPRTRTS